MEEMANSEHADPLLRRVETLEKDKGSLQTVVDMRNQEVTQLRTKINEQVFQVIKKQKKIRCFLSKISFSEKIKWHCKSVLIWLKIEIKILFVFFEIGN
jgi:hypothetical protein